MALTMSKAAARAEARTRRKAAYADNAAAAAEAVRDNFLAAIEVPSRAVIAGYGAFKDEIDPGPILRNFCARGHVCALPAVEQAGAPLRFRRWRPEDALGHGSLGEPAPSPELPLVEPDLLLVPLLAFDRAGYRLGYGGGYYDRTLAKLRAERQIIAVGLAFAAQEVPAVPHEPHDQRLDWVVTEREAVWIGQDAARRGTE